MGISPQQRLDYLDAMGVHVWVERGASTQSKTVKEEPSLSLQNLNLKQLSTLVTQCQSCDLSGGRQGVAFGLGAESAKWLIIGDLPSQQEKGTAAPFLAHESQLLNEMLKAIGEHAEHRYLTTAVKCSPQRGQKVSASALTHCQPYLLRQIELLQPTVILALGELAAQSLSLSHSSWGSLRGKVHYFKESKVPIIVSHHPADLLKSPLLKREAWQDLLLAREQFSK